MSFLFGGAKTQSDTTPKLTGIRIQTSVYGLCIPLLYGRNRVPGNLIWYGDFKAVAQQQTVGGKGGSASTAGYIYSTSFIMGLLEGPIASIEQVWNAKELQDIADTVFAVFLGDYPQDPWGYMSANHSGETLGYQGLVYVAAPNFDLGSNAELPNLNFDCRGRLLNVPGKDDADPADVVLDVLTNAYCGAGFPPSRMRSLTYYSNYCRAAGLLVSPLYSDATEANQLMQDLVDLTNSNFVWSEGMLGIIPFGDVALSGNGADYAPDLTPLYDLTDDDFQAEGGEDPVTVSRKRPADAYNRCTIEYLNRANQYNPETIQASDIVAIEQFGLRPEDTKQAHFFCDSQAAQTAAHLRVQGFRILNEYKFRLNWQYALLDPGDPVTITDVALGLVKKPVRIKEITEDEDGVLSFTAVELVQGTRSAAAYPIQPASGYGSSQDVDPGNIHEPLIFEPPKKLVSEPQIWCAVAGGPNWGGCTVWVSTDGATYRKVGTISAASRYGVLAADLPNHTDPDEESVLSVDLSTSHGELLSGTQQDADLFATLCYVDGEYISYETAVLTEQYKYDLSYLRRGANESVIGEHLAGSWFARLDSLIFKYFYTQNLTGVPIWIKFTSFNLFGGKEQNLADVDAYTITPGGESVPDGYTYDPDYTPQQYNDTGGH